ncbi:unnamed protein product, partial [Mesorhabditis belari]|uniref:THAP-type domain-containing protein n=1 Tax=Mesorhabditis belari TaxID=2138241 RepID=A0AAF3J5B5_9BILA
MERCVFCGWSRRTAYPSVRFFAIPKEPGLKRVQWLYAIGEREMSGRQDRVCSVHFRSGKPSSDPSHEDFAPHRYLDKEPPKEVIEYLERLVENNENGQFAANSQPKFKASVSVTNPSHVEFNKVSRPSILQRRKRTIGDREAEDLHEGSDDPETNEDAEQETSRKLPYTIEEVEDEPGTVKKMRLYPLQKEWVKQTGAVEGMKVVFRLKRTEPRSSPRKQALPEKTRREVVRIRMEDEHGNIIEERLVSEGEARRIQKEVELQQMTEESEADLQVQEQI